MPSSSKQQLRATIKAMKLSRLSPEYRAEASLRLMQAVERHPAFAAASTVMLYHALPDEPDTHTLLEKYAASKTIVLPCVEGDDIVPRVYRCEQDLRIGAYGIAEPIGPVFEDLPAISFILVPGVAFDAAGHRLGRGKGYYDRFLSALPARPFLLGACFAWQQVPAVPFEPHDIIMDAVLAL